MRKVIISTIYYLGHGPLVQFLLSNQASHARGITMQYYKLCLMGVFCGIEIFIIFKRLYYKYLKGNIGGKL